MTVPAARQRLWRISEVAQRYGLHPQTLRLYEREGLLHPSRSRGNTRYYAASDLERLECILSLSRDLGVNLAGIEVILHMRERLAQLQQELERMRELLEEQLLRAARGSPGALVRLSPRPLVRAGGRRRG